VDLSGVIFVALGVAWVLYLVPKVLRHYDEVAKSRTVEDFSDAVRVVARREPVTRTKTTLVRSDSPRIAPPTPQERRARRRAAASAARRRRITLGLLILAGIAVSALSQYGILLGWAPAVPGGLIVVFLLLSATLGRRERQLWQMRLVLAGPAKQPVPIRIPRPVAVRDEAGFAQVEANEDTMTFDAQELKKALAGNGVWDPLPMTLPTYVSKPVAKRAVRTIDLTAKGTYSAGHDAGDSALVAQSQATAREVAEEEVETQRAVGS
jgi:hypothetical protein